MIALHALLSAFLIFTCEPRPVIWQESCLEGCKIGCGNSQEALHKPDSFSCTNSPEPKLWDSRLLLCPSLAQRLLQHLLCLFISQFVCLLSSSAVSSPLALQSDGRVPLQEGQSSWGWRGGETASAHTCTVNGVFPCFYPKPFVGLCG